MHPRPSGWGVRGFYCIGLGYIGVSTLGDFERERVPSAGLCVGLREGGGTASSGQGSKASTTPEAVEGNRSKG